jgi:hypothetical protein
MTRNVPRRSVAALALVAAILTAAPAGAIGSGGSEGDLARITNAGDKLAQSGSAKFRGRSTQDGGGAGSKVTFDGAFDFGQRAGEYSATLAAFGVPSNEKVRGLVLDGAIYLGFDALRGLPGFESTPPDKEWLKLTPAILGVSEIAQRDPGVSLDALRGAKGEVKRVGRENVRGVRTTHYRVTVDLDQAIANAPEDQRSRVQDSAGALGSDTLPADVWIDTKGRLRKMKLRLEGTSVSNPGSVAFEFFELGAPFTVTRPAPNEVIDFAEIFGADMPPPGS